SSSSFQGFYAPKSCRTDSGSALPMNTVNPTNVRIKSHLFTRHRPVSPAMRERFGHDLTKGLAGGLGHYLDSPYEIAPEPCGQLAPQGSVRSFSSRQFEPCALRDAICHRRTGGSLRDMPGILLQRLGPQAHPAYRRQERARL